MPTTYNFIHDDDDLNLNDNNTTTGTNLADFITLDSAINVVTGLEGDDILSGTNGSDDTVRESGTFSLMTLSDSHLTIDYGFKVHTDELWDIEKAQLYSTSEGDVTIDASDFKGYTNIQAIHTALGTNNNLFSGAGGSTVSGGDGNDFMKGNKGKDILFWGGGANTFQGGAGDDEFYGGPDIDRVFAFSNGDLTLTDTQLIGNGIDQLVSIEAATLQGGNETMFLMPLRLNWAIPSSREGKATIR